ncbi:MAG TPA: AMP-binding protein, partial [Nannocystis sp.]
MILHALPWQRREHHPPAHVRTLVDLLLHRAAATPDLVIFRHLVDGDDDEQTLTLAALLTQARAIAVTLSRHLPPGARVLLPHPPGLEFAAALLGCMFAGLVGVPVPPPDAGRRGPALRRLLSICADAEVSAIFTVPAVLAAGDELRAALPAIPWFTTDDLDLALADEWTPPALAADTVAYLQYTSGSTADPKGVVIDHANLLHNCGALNEVYALDPTSVMVYWVPTYHDLGLVYGVALPLYIGFTAISMPPAAFLARPLRWLRAITRYRGTHSVAPNFAYELVVARTRPHECTDLDLTSWRHALNGAEPIRQSAEAAFLAAFAPYGLDPDALSHSYGMSEATAELTSEPHPHRGIFLKVAADALERGRVALADDTTRTRVVAGCGVPTGDTELLIVDPDAATLCAKGQVGEVWIRGASVARGYWRADAATERTFRARLASDPDTTYLRSGDLGFVHDGQLFITGRRKDLIIIRGENHYPQDLEWALQGRHPAVRPNSAVALSLDDARGEQLVLVTEVYPDHAIDPAPVFAAMREAAAEYGLQLGVAVLCPPGAVPKTSSGKVQRGPTKQLLRSGELRTLARWDLPTAEATDDPDEDLRDLLSNSDLAARTDLLRDYLGRLIAARLRVATVPSDVPVAQHGLDSLASVEIAERLSFQLRAPVLLGELHGTIDELAQLLAARRAEHTLVPAPGDRHADFPLHGIQQAYWVGRAGGALGGVSCHAYHELECIDLDLPRLGRAWQQLIARHDALRLVIDGDGRQRVLADVPPYTIARDDLGPLTPADRDTRLLATRDEISHQVLPADQWPLFRIHASALDEHRTRLHLGIDLLLADGASLSLLMHEWSRLYAGDTLPELPPCSFRDCALAELAARDSEHYRASLAYWSAHRPDVPGPELPLARRPEDLTGPARFVRRRAVIAPDVWSAIETEARRRHLGPSVVLCAAFTEVLATWSARPELLLNMTTFRRPPIHPRVHEIVGDFTTMALLTCRPAASFAALAAALQQQFHEQLDHRVVHGVEVLREWSRSGPVDVPVVFTSMIRSDGTGQWDTTWLGDEVHAISQTPHVWLDHQVLECNGELVSRWDAVEALFPPCMLDAMFAAFQARVSALAEQPALWDSPTPDLLPATERATIAAANATDAPFTATTLPALFHTQAHLRPH